MFPCSHLYNALAPKGHAIRELEEQIKTWIIASKLITPGVKIMYVPWAKIHIKLPLQFVNKTYDNATQFSKSDRDCSVYAKTIRDHDQIHIRGYGTLIYNVP